ncbi:FAP37 [Auxenochlorella protothecoides x Auxenochlorella symbiontica]
MARLWDVSIRFGCVLLGFTLRHVLDRLLKKDEGPARGGDASSYAQHSEEHKMVLVVNDELKMGKGKIGAQCAHAAVGAVELATLRAPHVLDAWESRGQAKICLRADSTAALLALGKKARAAGLVTYTVQDAGRTQVAPGSRTVLAIGPAPRTAFDAITGHLKLL